MNSIHCYNCYIFPSKSIEFYVTNCMHIYCINCKHLCVEQDAHEVTKCLTCEKPSIKFLKMDQNMGFEIKSYFAPLSNGFKTLRDRFSLVLNFQKAQRSNYLNGLRRKEECFDKLQAKYLEERKKKETYKQALIKCQQKLKEKTIELESFSSTRTLPESPLFNTRSSCIFDVYKTPCSNPNNDPFSTPKQPVIERTKSSLNSNSSASFIDEMTGAARSGRNRSK